MLLLASGRLYADLADAYSASYFASGKIALTPVLRGVSSFELFLGYSLLLLQPERKNNNAQLHLSDMRSVTEVNVTGSHSVSPVLNPLQIRYSLIKILDITQF